MCFSAQASFAAAGVLSVIGLISLKKAKSKFNRVLAITPLLFASQQFSEGMLWIFLPQNPTGTITLIFTYLFLIFALPFWPVWISSLSYCFEENPLRKSYLGILFIISVLLASFFFWKMFCITPQAEILNCHIYYTIGFSNSVSYISMILYLATTILPFFLLTRPFIWLFALTSLISYLFTFYFYRIYLISVWCFCTAILSLVILGIIIINNKKNFS